MTCLMTQGANGDLSNTRLGNFNEIMGQKLKRPKCLLNYRLEKDLKQLQENLNLAKKQQYADLQDQFNDIIENEVKGSILRSFCKEYASGEKCSKYFFSLENTEANRKL